MKQTAVEWLEEQLKKGVHNNDTSFYDLCEVAKEIEKQQITSAYNRSTYQFANDAEVIAPKSALEYYNETFKNK